MKKTTEVKITDYATTLFFMIVATILTYQNELLESVPEQYKILIIIGVGLLNQITAEIRANSNKDRGYKKGYHEAQVEAEMIADDTET